MITKAWLSRARQYLKHFWPEQDPRETAIDALLKQQQVLLRQALESYIYGSYDEWREINQESERLSKLIARLEAERSTEEIGIG